MSSDQNIEQVDYLIVGASVAGSVLAAKFAKKGSTLFVDKFEPGTLMNCGGGMPEHILKDFAVEIPFLHVKKGIMNINGRECWFPCNYVVVNRSELDRSLYKKACAGGAEFRQWNYSGNDSHDHVAFFKDKHKARKVKYKKLILTFGFHPGRNPFSGKNRKLKSGAARVEVLDCKSKHSDEFYFYIYQQKQPGYHWVFPMPGHTVNIGTGGFKSANVPLIAIADLKKREQLSAKVLKKGGGVLPLSPVAKIQCGDVYLFGDSAGMVNALNGEGLMHIAKFAEKFSNGLIRGKNLNIIWYFSKTYWYLLCAAVVLKVVLFMGAFMGLSLYPQACRFVAFIRRCKG